MGLKEVICNEEDVGEVLDKFQDVFDLEQELKVSRSPDILKQDELPPSYGIAGTSVGSNTIHDRGRRRSSVDLLEDFDLWDTYEQLLLDGGIITLEISLW